MYQFLPLLSQTALKYLSQHRGCFFVIPVAKTFPGPLVLPRLPTIHPHFHSSRWRCWTLLTSEGKEDLFFLSAAWFRDISSYTTDPDQNHFQCCNRRQTPEDMQNTTRLRRDEAVGSHYNAFENIFFWNVLTFHRCVGFSGTITEMQGLNSSCICNCVHTAHKAKAWVTGLGGSFFWACYSLQGQAWTSQHRSHLLSLAFLLVWSQKVDFDYKKETKMRKTALNSHQTLIFCAFATTRGGPEQWLTTEVKE